MERIDPVTKYAPWCRSEARWRRRSSLPMLGTNRKQITSKAGKRKWTNLSAANGSDKTVEIETKNPSLPVRRMAAAARQISCRLFPMALASLLPSRYSLEPSSSSCSSFWLRNAVRTYSVGICLYGLLVQPQCKAQLTMLLLDFGLLQTLLLVDFIGLC